MSKEQIEEMARDMVDSDNKEATDALSLFFVKVAEHLYTAGYRKQSEWTSVDERLPKQWETVLIFQNGIVDTDFISSSGVWYDHFPERVTHWMPLPEAPKMKGGAE